MKRPVLLRPSSRPRVFLSVRASSSRREIVACLTLNAFVVSGWLLPFTSSLQVAQARGVVASPGARPVVPSSRSSAAVSQFGKKGRAASDAPPSWYRAAQKREGKLARAREEVRTEMKREAQKRQSRMRLAQFQGDVPPQISALPPGVDISRAMSSPSTKQVSGFRLLKESFPVALKESAPLYVPNPYTSPLKVDLSNGRVPTQKEVSGLGSSCGALAPAAPAEPKQFQEDANTNLRGQGYAQGLDTNMPPSEELTMDPPRQARAKHLEDVRERVKSAKNQNRDLASAMMDWNTAHWKDAKKKLEEFAKAYPKSPWEPEALIHLADLAKSSAQPNEAEDGYRKVLAMTSDQPGAMGFEAHQKAYERWADLYLREGRYGQARPMLEDIVAHDLHWRRVTWAYSWLMQLNAYTSDQKTTLASLDCGSKALATMLVDLGHARAGREVAALAPNNKRGFSLADLQLMGAKRGVQLVGFRARAAQMVGAPLPLVLHYAARQVAPTTARRLKNARMKGAPVRSLESYAHFVVVRGYDAKAKMWSVFNPQDGARALLTSAQLDKESSGTGLMLEAPVQVQGPQKAVWLANWPKNKHVVAAPAQVRLAPLPLLSKREMQRIVGTCYAVQAPGGLGCQSANMPVRGDASIEGCNSCSGSHGEPKVSVNAISQNIFITDTPVWYHPAKGPSVEVSVSYNSQDASNYDSPTGNKWTFGFTSHIAEMPNQVSVFMPGGAQTIYTIPSSAITTTTDPSTGQQVTKVADTYTAGSPRGVFSTLVKTAPGTFSLKSQDGSQWSYGIPSGTSSTVSMLLSQTNRWNQSLTLQYGTIGGKIVPFTLTDADGKLTRFQYDGNGHLIYAQTPDERQASFSYDASGNLIQCVDAAGQAFQYAYDNSATVTQLNTAQGAWTFQVLTGTNADPSDGQPSSPYDSETKITDPTQSHPRKFVFHDGPPYQQWHNGHYYFTDHAGNQTSVSVATLSSFYDLNPISEIASINSPTGESQSVGYNTTSGSSIVSPTSVSNGRTTMSVSYNNMGQATQAQIVANGSGDTRTTQITYDQNGVDVTGVQVSGMKQGQTQSQTVLQSATYNTQHQPLSTVNAQGHEVDTTYTSWGAPLSVTTHEGSLNHVKQYVYGQTPGTNEYNRVVALIQDGVTQVTYTYDASGRVRTSTDITGRTTSYRYNNLDSPLGIYYPDGTSQMTDYTCCALPGMTTDRSGRRSYYDYDQLKRLVRVQDADGQTLQFSYDADGNRTSLLDANGVKTKWSYDGQHRPLAKQYADGNVEQYDYTSFGKLNSTTNMRGGKTVLGYSIFGELSSVTYPTTNTPNVTFGYDALGRRTSMTDGVGTSSWSYDGTGRLQSESGPLGNDTITYGYDSLDRLQNLSVQRDATSSDSENLVYDGLGRMASLSASAGSFGSVGTFNYSYVGNTSMVARMDRPNGTSTLFGYENLQDTNSLHRLTGVQDVNTATGANIAGFSYGYDSANVANGFRDNRTTQTRAYGAEAAQTVSYGYNPTSMLQGEEAAQGGASTPAVSKSYSFDAMGNRLSMTDAVAQTQKTSAYNNLNQLTGQGFFNTASGQPVATGSSSFGYDSDGNMALVTSKDANGNVTGQTSYTYDDASRLIGITTPGSSKWQFVYDGFSRLRISRSWNWQNGAWEPTSEKRRVYLDRDVVQERDSQNNVVASDLRAGNIGGLLARTTATGSVFYGYDGSGNVTSLTDGTGALVGSYSYDAWGNLLASSGTASNQNPFLYATKEQLAGLCFYGYRFYSSGLGRWINRDPLGERGGANVYVAMGDNPVNKTDFYGLYVVAPPSIPMAPSMPPGITPLQPGQPIPYSPTPDFPQVWPPTAPGGGGAGAVGGGGAAVDAGAAAGGVGAAGAATGAGAVLVIVYAGHDILTYRPCQPLGWGNALTWLGDRLADDLYGAQPCGCPTVTGPFQDPCEAQLTAWIQRNCDPLLAEGNFEAFKKCMKEAHKRYRACKDGQDLN